MGLIMRRVDNCREPLIKRKFHWYMLFTYTGDIYGSEDITVVCKQTMTAMGKRWTSTTKISTSTASSTTTTITSTPAHVESSTHAPSTPKPGPIIWCDEESRNSAPKAMLEKVLLDKIKDHRNDNGACYFQIQGVTEEANQRETVDGRKIFFDVQYAREQCRKFYGTLLTIRDKIEESYIWDMFPLFAALGADVKLVNKNKDAPAADWIIDKWDEGLPGMDAPNPLVKEYGPDDENKVQALIMHKKDPFDNAVVGREFWWFILFSHARGPFPDITVICKQNVSKTMEPTPDVTTTTPRTTTTTSTKAATTPTTPTTTGSDPGHNTKYGADIGARIKSSVFGVIMVACGALMV